MSNIINVNNQKNNRDYYVDLIMKSNWPKKIIVSGPGTGKTYLFKKILTGKSNGIALTFINNLAQQLAKIYQKLQMLILFMPIVRNFFTRQLSME